MRATTRIPGRKGGGSGPSVCPGVGSACVAPSSTLSFALVIHLIKQGRCRLAIRHKGSLFVFGLREEVFVKRQSGGVWQAVRVFVSRANQCLRRGLMCMCVCVCLAWPSSCQCCIVLVISRVNSIWPGAPSSRVSIPWLLLASPVWYYDSNTSEHGARQAEE